MTDILCGYLDRAETIVAFLYDDLDAGQRRLFEAHLLTCAACHEEVSSLRGVRTQLARWAPPEPFGVAGRSSPELRATSAGSEPWWREIPAWAQVAAALLFLGVSAGIANLDVRYDQNGLSVRTGWLRTAGVAPSLSRDARIGGPGAVSAANDAPWRSDLAALERQLKTEFHASQVSAAVAPAAQPVRVASSADAETLRRVRALLEESEKRQQRELALRVAEVVRDVNAQRQVDLRNIDRTLGVVRNDLGVEVMKQRQSLNLLYRASQRQ
jgi:anti-sigma factor RsiW